MPTLRPLLTTALAGGALTAFLLGDALRGALPERAPWPAGDATSIPRVVVLGFDGVDAAILAEYLQAEQLPALKALAEEGTLQPLLSELPPESPVAWASLLTGVNPGRHGILDFVIPREDLTPVNGMVELRPLRLLLGRFPVRPPLLRSRLGAPTFLEKVHAAGYSVLALRQPHLFPAPVLPGAHLLAGLGTPDLSGSAGAYTQWSARIGYTSMVTEFGGLQMPLKPGAVPGRFDSVIEGPPDPSLGPGRFGGVAHATQPIRFEVTGAGEPTAVVVSLGGTSQVLSVKSRSEFFPVRFRLGTLPAIEVAGLVRLEVQSLDPLTVMADPVQIDPGHAQIPLSTPASYGAELVARYGPTETMGWREQTFALNDWKQDDAAFLRDALDDMRRDGALLLGELARGSRCAFQCITATDRVSHAFFRLRDHGHPLYRPDVAARLGDPILATYKEMDHIVAAVRAKLDPQDLLLVCSDHGFQTWRYGLNVNRWLADEGYLVLKHEMLGTKNLGQFFSRGDLGLDAIDWSRTRAVAIGLGQIFLNVKGLRPEGCVEPADVPALRREIADRILAYRNPLVPEEAPVKSVAFLHDVYSGPYAAEAGDLQLGFAPGYRVSWQTALLGGLDGQAMERNERPWSGDHCSTDPASVPGVLLSNRRLPAAPKDRPYHVRDVAASVLAHFHLDVSDLDGRPLPFAAAPASPTVPPASPAAAPPAAPAAGPAGALPGERR